jgi:Short C-terminal domain
MGVLTRPPSSGGEMEVWTAVVVDPVAQIKELAELRDRGLLSSEEFERQKWRALNPQALW